MKYQFLLKSYLILGKNISLNKGKPEKQEFELITLSLYKINISKIHMEQSVESNFFKKFKAIASLLILRPYFSLFVFFLKKIFQKIQ